MKPGKKSGRSALRQGQDLGDHPPLGTTSRKQDADVLDSGDEPILNLLSPHPPPARTFESVIVGRIPKALLDQELSASTIAPRRGAVGLGPCLIKDLLVLVSMDGATGLCSGALLAQRTLRTNPLGQVVFPGFAMRVQPAGSHQLPGRAAVSVVLGPILKLAVWKNVRASLPLTLSAQNIAQVSPYSLLLAGDEVLRRSVLMIGHDRLGRLLRILLMLANHLH